MTSDDTPKRPRGRPPKPKTEPEAPKIPKPTGRPVMDPAEKKSVNVTVRLTQAEYELWRTMAREQGITLVDFIMMPVRQKMWRMKHGEGGES